MTPILPRRRPWVALTLVAALALFPSFAMAADNTGTGDIAGVSGDLTDSNVFQLTSTTLGLVKRAFDAAGNPIPTASSLPRGTQVRFLIYVNNNTPVAVNDISVQDVLDTGTFAYSTGTIKVDNNVVNCALAACTGVEEQNIFDTTVLTAALTDLADGDAVAYDGTDTIDAGDQNEALNSQVNVSANTVWAMVFTVTMQ